MLKKKLVPPTPPNFLPTQWNAQQTGKKDCCHSYKVNTLLD